MAGEVNTAPEATLPNKVPPVAASYQRTKDPSPAEVWAVSGTVPGPQLLTSGAGVIVGSALTVICTGKV